MKKIITVVSFLLAVLMLASCTPAKDYVSDTTEKQLGILGTPDVGTANEFKDYAMCSDNYAMYVGEYYYFFFTYLSQFVNNYTVDQYKELNFDPDTSLKEQYVKDGSQTWYDFFKELTVEYMEKILLSCEAAKKTDSRYAKEAKNYVNALKAQMESVAKENGISFSDLVFQLYGGNVSTQSYLNAIQMEYIHSLFYAEKYNATLESITEEEARAYGDSLEGEKDTTLTRNLAYVMVDDGEAKAKAFLEEFNAKENKSYDVLKELADASDYSSGCFENNVESTINVKEISSWLFAEERQIGDATHVFVEDDGHYVVYYYSDGVEKYVADAKDKLANKKTDEYYESVKESCSLKYDEEKLDSLNA